MMQAPHPCPTQADHKVGDVWYCEPCEGHHYLTTYTFPRDHASRS